MKKLYALISLALITTLFSIWFFHPNQSLKRKSKTVLNNFTVTEKSNIISKSLFSGKIYAKTITLEVEQGVSYFKQIPYLQTKRSISNANMVRYSQSVNHFAHILEHTPSDLTVTKLEKNTYAVEFTDLMRIKLKHSLINTSINCQIRFVFIKSSKSDEGYQLNKIIFF